MTGAEFATKLHRSAEDSDCEHHEFMCSPCFYAMIAREFDAALAAMTAERDSLNATSHVQARQRLSDMNDEERLQSQLKAARSERDAARAMWNTQANELLVTREELQAAMVALGRAHAALRDGLLCLPDDFDLLPRLRDEARAVLADPEGPEGRAAAEYVAALEAEHEAAGRYRKSIATHVVHIGGGDLDDAHAAVEALRGK